MNAESRHVPLRPLSSDPAAAAKAIDEIIADALEHFGGDRFWPAHPLDDDVKDGNSSVYMGAAGMIWALEYLRGVGASKTLSDFRPYLTQLLEKTRAEMQGYGSYSVTGSLLLGDMGTALMIMRLAPSPGIADVIAARANANTQLPIRELMWGMAGSMMACLAMNEMTNEERWRRIFESISNSSGQCMATPATCFRSCADGSGSRTINARASSMRCRVRSASMPGAVISAQRGGEPSSNRSRPICASIVTVRLAWSRHLPTRRSGLPSLRRSCSMGAATPGLWARSPRAPTFVTAPAAMAMRFSSSIAEPATPSGLSGRVPLR